MPTVIEELLIGLGIKDEASQELDQFKKKSEDAADSASRRFGAMAKDVGKSFAIVGAAATAGAAAIFKFVDSQTAQLDATAKGARAAGISAAEYQRLAFASERSGVSMEAVSKSARFLEKSLADAHRNAASPAALAFQELGLGLDAFDGKSFEERLGLVADALQGVEDEQRRTLLAARALGEEGGPRMASLLADGAAGVKALGDEAERLGRVVGEETLTKAEQFQDSLTNLKAEAQGVATEIAGKLIPTAQKLIPVASGAADGAVALTNGFISLTEAIGGGNVGLVGGLGLLAITLGGLPAVFAATAAAGVAAGSAIANAFADAGQSISELNAKRDRELARGKKIEAGRGALSELQKRANAGELGRLSDSEYEKLAESVLRSGGNQESVGRLLATFDSQRAEQLQASKEERDFAAAKNLTAYGAKQLTVAQLKGKGGGGDPALRRGRALAEELGLADELRRSGGSADATEKAIESAIEAAARQIAAGASRSVARKAGFSTLGSLTGVDFAAKSSDPLLSELFGNSDLPDAPVSQLEQGQQPQVLLSTINNNFSIEIANNFDGARDPASVAESVVDRFREMFSEEITRTSKLSKVVFAR